MKAMTVKLDDGGLDGLMRRVRTGQELGFTNFDLTLCSPQTALGRIVHALQQSSVGLTTLRLKEDRHSAFVTRRPGYAKLGAADPQIAGRSAEMIVQTAEQLAPAKPRFLVLDGGYVQVPSLNERQLQLDELLNCDECDQARMQELAHIDTALADQQLDHLLRGLHAITKALAPLEICLLPPESPFGLLQPERMQHVFDDLGGRNVGYWHCTSNVAILRKLGGPPELDWLARFGQRLRGVYLEDMLGGHGEQAPGLGEIDFEKLAPELAQGTIRVMVVSDDKGTKLRFGSEHLAKVGIF